jgi:hypothetical protein
MAKLCKFSLPPKDAEAVYISLCELPLLLSSISENFP